MSTETAIWIVGGALALAAVLASAVFVAGTCILALVMHRLARFLLVQVLWANNFVSRQLSKSGHEYVARGEADQRAANQDTRKEPFAEPETPDGEWHETDELVPLGEPTRGVPEPARS